VSVTASDPSAASVTSAFSLQAHIVLGTAEDKKEPYSFSPNPFRETVECTVSLAEDAYIRLTVTDSFGRTIVAPLNGRYGPGKIIQPVNLTGKASGMYYYSLYIDGAVFSGKLLKHE
jgi:hypothetical protein